MNNAPLSRRRFLQYSTAAGLGAFSHRLLPNYAPQAATATDHRAPINLNIAARELAIAGEKAIATTLNGMVPGPLVRLKEGQDAIIRVTNSLSEDSSIHWHGVILPFQMDGVPGLSYDGIQPGETFEYRFPVKQNGTYWYHSHSGLQEQTGVYGPIIIDAARPEPWQYDREYVVLLSDWTFLDPHTLLAKLKKEADYSNYQQQTLIELFAEAKRAGIGPALKDRLMWSQMRMMPTDIADVTGAHYTYLLNGIVPDGNWTGLFKPGERVRLRFINAAAGSYFDVRIPGLPMTVVQADGQNVAPVEVDEFRIAIAETYDVIVEPKDDVAYTIFAEAMDRSGYARGSLAPRPGMTAAVPQRRERPLLTMRDMGMDMGEMEGMDGMYSKALPEASSVMSGMDHSKMNMTPPAASQAPESHGSAMSTMQQGQGGAGQAYRHDSNTHGLGNSSVAMVAQSRLHEPGLGLEGSPWKVLTYADLQSPGAGYDLRSPRREIEIHLTGNMERYMWSFDGEQFSEGTAPIRLVHGERVRLSFINDTMMNHPIHLHGMWMVLDNGHGKRNPRKHTINVKPAEKLSADVTVDAPGNWAFHCHILFHMEMGMFRVVSVSKPLNS